MKRAVVSLFILLITLPLFSQSLQERWQSPPQGARSWVFWYWMQGAVTKEGITADLEAMKQIGLGGAYLMPIKGVPEKPFITPIVEQLSPLWWEMVRFAFQEADRVGIQIGFHVCDGFALAGGPWITPELSMQKVVWSMHTLQGGKQVKVQLPKPEANNGYYKEIATFAYPAQAGEGVTTAVVKPIVTSSEKELDPQFLVEEGNETIFRSENPCWIVYRFEGPFTCRSIEVVGTGNNFQAQRLTIEASEDGINYRKVVQLVPPRQGWQNNDFPMTHAIPETTSRYYRFLYDKAGTEPGAEDLDAAKWKQVLKIKGIKLSSATRINQFEGKNGSVWRVSPRTTNAQVSLNRCVNSNELIDVSAYVDPQGVLNWNAPKGSWTILRMGHTTTGHTNATGGKGAGLECDKFNPIAIRMQFNAWYGKAYEVAGKELADRVLKLFHVDSWECGSQNWSPLFRAAFKAHRGYELYPYLPLMAGIPIDNVELSERVLLDVRKTISELVVAQFYTVLKEEAHAKGASFSAESVAPTMVSDGMLHYKEVDTPMGEFWLQSPTHDKPNDMLDAISGAHLYGKNVVQAEAFTQLRTMWNEHPGMLKSLQDRTYALGINRLSYHVSVLNPWLDRAPGMTLDGIGLYFQRDQTWWKPGKAWVEYGTRCQALLQAGLPVVDLAVFTGEELPRRALLPDRLVNLLPGIMGADRVEAERIRLANVGELTVQMPVGVHHSAQLANPKDWINPLRGYAYDSFNPDALLRLAEVKEGKIVLPGGASYSMLILPGVHPMNPNPECLSEEVAKRLVELLHQGATILFSDVAEQAAATPINSWSRMLNEQGISVTSKQSSWQVGKGRLVRLPYTADTFSKLGLQRDFVATDEAGKLLSSIAYTHRQTAEADLYFVSNQEEVDQKVNLSLRQSDKVPEIWNPVSGEIRSRIAYTIKEGRTHIPIQLAANESCFVIFQKQAGHQAPVATNERTDQPILAIDQSWLVDFTDQSAISFPQLIDWTTHTSPAIQHYSGSATYRTQFSWDRNVNRIGRYFLQLTELYNLATVRINGMDCGTLWTKPYRLEITDALKQGINLLEIEVTNTWANRLMGHEANPELATKENSIWTNAPYRLAGQRLVPSGLVGPVWITKQLPMNP